MQAPGFTETVDVHYFADTLARDIREGRTGEKGEMANSKPSFFDAPSIAIITGASRGIGRGIAIEFAKRFEDELYLVLTGRSAEDLQETFSLIKSNRNYSPEKTTVRIVLGDLANQTDFPSLLDGLFGDFDSTRYQHAILVSNAGSLGDATKFTRDFQPSDSSEIQDYFFLNVTATLLMTSRFLSTFSIEGFTRRTIVQISSGASVRGLASWSLYCTGKAARDMLHKVIAVEEPEIKVLSYAPGPVDTAMLHYGKEHTASQLTTKMVTELHRIMVTPEEAASVLCEVLREDNYESGTRVHISDLKSQRGNE